VREGCLSEPGRSAAQPFVSVIIHLERPLRLLCWARVRRRGSARLQDHIGKSKYLDRSNACQISNKKADERNDFQEDTRRGSTTQN